MKGRGKKISICVLGEADWKEWVTLITPFGAKTYKDYLKKISALVDKHEDEGYTVDWVNFDKTDFERYCQRTETPRTTPNELIAARAAWAKQKKNR